MAHPTSRGNRKPSPETINKAGTEDNQKYNVSTKTNLDPNINRMRLGAYSLPSLKTVQGMIQEEARRELRFPQAAKIYKQMTLDANIASALAITEAMISQVKWNVKAPRSAPSEESKRAEMLDYNLLVMERPFSEYISEILSYLVYGFHLSEKMYEKKSTPVGDFVGWKNFVTISQDTVWEWILDNQTGSLAGVKQKLAGENSSWFFNPNKESEVEVPRKKFFLVRHNTKRDNPEGVSPLRSCYIDWKYLAFN